MRKIKLSGREIGLIRVIGFGVGATGTDLLTSTNYDATELLDMINGMMNAGFIVTVPYLLEVHEDQLRETLFEINSAYSHELKKSLPMRF